MRGGLPWVVGRVSGASSEVDRWGGKV
jgi:hypothetical protein